MCLFDSMFYGSINNIAVMASGLSKGWEWESKDRTVLKEKEAAWKQNQQQK